MTSIKILKAELYTDELQQSLEYFEMIKTFNSIAYQFLLHSISEVYLT